MDYCGGGAKGMLAPLSNYWGGLAPPGPPLPTPMYTQGIVTKMAYFSVTNIHMPCGDHETPSLSGCASPLSSNLELSFYSPVDGLRPFFVP